MCVCVCVCVFTTGERKGEKESVALSHVSQPSSVHVNKVSVSWTADQDNAVLQNISFKVDKVLCACIILYMFNVHTYIFKIISIALITGVFFIGCCWCSWLWKGTMN